MDVTKGTVDWSSEEDYAYVTELNYLGCAWELLRRLPEYKKDWEAFSISEEGLGHNIKYSGKELPIFKVGEIGANPDIYLSPSEARAKKWLLRSMKDPNEKYSPELTFRNVAHFLPREIQSLDELDVYFATELTTDPDRKPTGDLQVVSKNYGIVVFDLTKGLQDQWLEVKKALKVRAKAAEKKHPKVVEETLISYLRMLDAGSDPTVRTVEAYIKIYGEEATVRVKYGSSEVTKIAHEKLQQALQRARSYKDMIHHHCSGKVPGFKG